MTGASPAPTRQSAAHSVILDLIVQNAALADILVAITAMVERQIAGSRALIVLLDGDGAAIRPGAGPLGRAAYEKALLGPTDDVLGTFAVYVDTPRNPEPDELDLMHDAGQLAAMAVQHDRVRRLLHDTNRTNALTGLANRLVLIEELKRLEGRSARTGDRFAVIQVAVEGMAVINESLGPSVGDAVLRTVADRLTATVAAPGLVTHVWGCDFVVLIEGLAADADARVAAERIRDAIVAPYAIEGMTLELGAMLGVATWGGGIAPPQPFDEPLRAASVALERARQVGTLPIGVYDPGSDPAVEIALLGPALRRGIDQEELTLAYQPVVTLADEQVDHYEALLRWTTALGSVPPDSFVPVAEQTGLVTDLGRYALERALRELAQQRAAGRDVGMSVNLSVRQLSDNGLPDLIADLLERHALPAEAVTMEITEGVMLSSSGRGWEALQRIREVGVRISLDDFGTGFSQIGYLRRFRFDEIKLDRSLIRDMDQDRTARAIILGGAAFARSAELPLVAEGIERRSQADQLRDVGCTHGQGYLFGAPSPTASVAGTPPGS